MARVTTKIPDGNGGWVELEGEAVEGAKANKDKQQEALEQSFHDDVDGLIQWLWKQGRLYQQEHGLTEEQVAFAIALLGINVRQTFPKGGPEAFDKINVAAWEYFESANG